MTKPESLRCGECGHRGLMLKNVEREYQAPWADFPKLRLSVPLELPCCPQCGNVVIPGDEVSRLNMAMEESAKKLVQALIDEVQKLCGLSGRGLARLLGVTPEHLSTVAHGRKRPSFQMAQTLLIFRSHPEIVGELQDYWRLGTLG